MWSQDKFYEEFVANVGEAVAALTSPQEVARWQNAGQRQLGVYREKWQDIYWNANDIAIALPSDFVRPEKIEEAADSVMPLPAYRIWGDPKELIFPEPPDEAGSARLYYYATWPRVTSDAPSVLPEVGDDACLCYALYRFFKRLASSRSDYRKFATTVAANGVDISELDALSERHYNDFLATRDEMQERDDQAITFWEG